jgi:asparagine synthetase B (glutamine-hydrolysing)
LRGEEVVSQPLRTDDGRYMLLWNGEVFHTTLANFDLDEHDGKQILDCMQEMLRKGETLATSFASTLSSVEGPYAAILIDTVTGSMCFTRDPIGRRSLLMVRSDNEIVLTSAASHSLLSTYPDIAELDCKSMWQVLTGTRFDVESVPRTLNGEESTTLRELRTSILDGALDAARSDEVVEEFRDILSESVRQRVQHLRYHGSSSVAQIAVLFSGGLDCCTIALLAHLHLPEHQPIDLLNVAFQNPRVLAAAEGRNPYDVPDRLTGKQSFQELQRVAPTRQWKFVEVNVPFEEYVMSRSTIETLMTPCKSVMDLSIASALYFASRANTEFYNSTAKVLLSGLGADELLGGYSRHRQAWQSGGLSNLVQELQMDLDRLPTRNLGRDDRIISQNGKESRYPFLDREVIRFLASLPVQNKMNFSLEPGKGDKMVLRQLAKQLGLHQTSLLTKRAIQFGARSAKMEAGDGRIKGHEKLPIFSVKS